MPKVEASKVIKKPVEAPAVTPEKGKRSPTLTKLVEKFQNFKKLVNKKLVEMYNETKELFLAENSDQKQDNA